MAMWRSPGFSSTSRLKSFILTNEERSMNYRKRARRQHGFLDIQLNAVLVISAILGGAALLAGIAYINTAKTEALHTGHRQMVDDLRKSYRNAENFSGLSTDRTVTLKAVPRAWIRGNAIENNVGGAVTVTSATVVNSNDSFQIEHAGLNERSEEHTSELQSRGHIVC